MKTLGLLIERIGEGKVERFDRVNPRLAWGFVFDRKISASLAAAVEQMRLDKFRRRPPIQERRFQMLHDLAGFKNEVLDCVFLGVLNSKAEAFDLFGPEILRNAIANHSGFLA